MDASDSQPSVPSDQAALPASVEDLERRIAEWLVKVALAAREG